MLVAIITALIYICVAAIVVHLILWVLGMVGVPIPPMVVQLIWVIFALVCLLILAKLLIPAFGGMALLR